MKRTMSAKIQILNTVGWHHPFSIPSITNHTIPSTTNHSISPNERIALATTRQQRKRIATWVVPSPHKNPRTISSRRVTDVEQPALHDVASDEGPLSGHQADLMAQAHSMEHDQFRRLG
jgi:hypothetical protein